MVSLVLLSSFAVFLSKFLGLIGPRDIKSSRNDKNHYISNKFEGQGHWSKCKNSSIQPGIRKFDSCHECRGEGQKVQIQGQRSKIKVVGQGQKCIFFYFQSTLKGQVPN